MPFFDAKSGKPPTVLFKDGARIVAYTLTSHGAKQLRAAGVRSGQKFSSRLLVSLIRSGHAHSPQAADATGQAMLGFLGDDTGNGLPRCEMTGATSDLHLVVYGEGAVVAAKLLAAEPRFVLQKVTTLSVPITLLTSAGLEQLETTGKLPPGTAAATILRRWYRQDFEEVWKQTERRQAQRQESLALGSGADELALQAAAETVTADE